MDSLRTSMISWLAYARLGMHGFCAGVQEDHVLAEPLVRVPGGRAGCHFSKCSFVAVDLVWMPGAVSCFLVHVLLLGLLQRL